MVTAVKTDIKQQEIKKTGSCIFQLSTGVISIKTRNTM